MPPGPSSPASMPTTRKTSRKDSPARAENRPASTLAKTSAPATSRADVQQFHGRRRRDSGTGDPALDGVDRCRQAVAAAASPPSRPAAGTARRRGGRRWRRRPGASRCACVSLSRRPRQRPCSSASTRSLRAISRSARRTVLVRALADQLVRHAAPGRPPARRGRVAVVQRRQVHAGGQQAREALEVHEAHRHVARLQRARRSHAGHRGVGGAVHQALARRAGRCPRRRRGRGSPCALAQRRCSSALTAAAAGAQAQRIDEFARQAEGKVEGAQPGPGLGQQRLESGQAWAARPAAAAAARRRGSGPRATARACGAWRLLKSTPSSADQRGWNIARDCRGAHYSRRCRWHAQRATNPVWPRPCAAASSSRSTAARWPSSTPTAACTLALGDIERPIFPRSAVKVLQALPLVASGAADRWQLTDEELALACASHGGEPRACGHGGRPCWPRPAWTRRRWNAAPTGPTTTPPSRRWPRAARRPARCTTTARASMPASSAWAA